MRFGNGTTYGGVPAAYAKYNEYGEGRSHKVNKNVSFDGRKFKSYWTEIACYHNGPQGAFCLIDEYRYSVSTESHKRVIRKSVSRFLEVPCIYIETELDHNKNIAFLQSKVEQVVHNMISSWKRFYSGYPNNISADSLFGRCDYTFYSLNELYNNIIKYKHYTGIEYTPPKRLHELQEHVISEIKLRFARYTDPKAVKRRERAYARRVALKALGLS